MRAPSDEEVLEAIRLRLTSYLRFTILCTLTAARSSRASSPGAAVSCSPKGKRSPTGIGTEIAGTPSAVHGVFMLESPVDASPKGAGPVAEGARITGVLV